MSYDIIIENFDNSWNEYENFNSNQNDDNINDNNSDNSDNSNNSNNDINEFFKNKKSAKKKGVKKVSAKKAGPKKVGAKKVGAKKAGAKKVGAKKAGAKKAGAKKVGTKKAGPKKAGAKKVGAKKAGAKKAGAKKVGAKKVGAKKASAKKTGAKKAGAKKAGAKKAGAKKAGAKKAGSKKTGSKKIDTKKAGSKKTGSKKTGAKKAGAKKLGIKKTGTHHNGIKPIDHKAISQSSINNFDKDFPNLFDRPTNKNNKPLVKYNSSPQIKHVAVEKKTKSKKINKKKPLKPAIISLNTGIGDKLYNQRYCNIVPTKNSMVNCENCIFDKSYLTKRKLKEIIYQNQNQCINDCNKDKKCTGYTYNTKNKKCTKYSGYPRDIIKDNSAKHINSGYIINVNRPLHFNKLSKKLQENIKKKCVGQYLNLQYRNIKNDLTDCIKKISSKNKKTLVEIDKECAFKSLDHPKIIRKYKVIKNFTKSRKDPAIDKSEKIYNKYNNLRKKNTKVLKSLESKSDEN